MSRPGPRVSVTLEDIRRAGDERIEVVVRIRVEPYRPSATRPTVERIASFEIDAPELSAHLDRLFESFPTDVDEEITQYLRELREIESDTDSDDGKDEPQDASSEPESAPEDTDSDDGEGEGS